MDNEVVHTFLSRGVVVSAVVALDCPRKRSEDSSKASFGRAEVDHVLPSVNCGSRSAGWMVVGLPPLVFRFFVCVSLRQVCHALATFFFFNGNLPRSNRLICFGRIAIFETAAVFLMETRG